MGRRYKGDRAAVMYDDKSFNCNKEALKGNADVWKVMES